MCTTELGPAARDVRMNGFQENPVQVQDQVTASVDVESPSTAQVADESANLTTEEVESRKRKYNASGRQPSDVARIQQYLRQGLER